MSRKRPGSSIPEPETSHQRPRRNISRPAYDFGNNEEDENEFQDDFEVELEHPDEDERYETEESDHETASEEEADSSDEEAEVVVQAKATAVATTQSVYGAPEPSYYLGKNQQTLWNKQPKDASHKKSQCNSFKPGRNKLPKVNNELEAFELFFDVSVFERIVQYTNIYIQSVKDKLNYQRSRVRPTDVLEIRAFFGLLICIGSLKSSKVAVEHLWKPEDGTAWDLCRCTMSYGRFCFLMR